MLFFFSICGEIEVGLLLRGLTAAFLFSLVVLVSTRRISGRLVPENCIRFLIVHFYRGAASTGLL